MVGRRIAVVCDVLELRCRHELADIPSLMAARFLGWLQLYKFTDHGSRFTVHLQLGILELFAAQNQPGFWSSPARLVFQGPMASIDR